MLTNEQRSANYFIQNKGKALTPAQRRRIKAKAHRERDIIDEAIAHRQKVAQRYQREAKL